METACHELTGQCHCKVNVEGLKCNSCKPGTFNLDSANQQGCLNCFGYGRAVNCTSANGFVASTLTSDFVNETGILNMLVYRSLHCIHFLQIFTNCVTSQKKSQSLEGQFLSSLSLILTTLT